MQRLDNCTHIVNIPTLTVKSLYLVEGDSFNQAFKFYIKGTSEVIPLPEGTTGHFKANYGYHGNTILLSELVIDSATNTTTVNLLPTDTNGLGVNFSPYVSYKYALTFTLPDGTVKTYQMGDLVVVSNVIPQVSPV